MDLDNDPLTAGPLGTVAKMVSELSFNRQPEAYAYRGAEYAFG
jgi:hypothetical protein